MDEIEEIVEFILKEGTNYHRKQNIDEIKKRIGIHLKYGTGMVIREIDNNIVAIAGWDLIGDHTAHIIDIVVKKEYRRPRILRELLAVGLSKNPTIKYITYERAIRNDLRIRICSVDKFLRRRNTDVV